MNTVTMAEPIADEFVLLAGMLPLAGARVLDLGCGKGDMSRRIVREGAAEIVVALETDAIQHAENLASEPCPGLHFASGAAQRTGWPAASFDAVVMLKSLHHVPRQAMDAAFAEIRRVLRPGGDVYVSEPVFAGEFNEIMRLFHDEQVVREEALSALRRAVSSGAFEQIEERHFVAPIRFRDFDEFERRMMHVTHTSFSLDEALVSRVKARFERSMGADGAHFMRPMRVNHLRSSV